MAAVKVLQEGKRRPQQSATNPVGASLLAMLLTWKDRQQAGSYKSSTATNLRSKTSRAGAALVQWPGLAGYGTPWVSGFRVSWPASPLSQGQPTST